MAFLFKRKMVAVSIRKVLHRLSSKPVCEVQCRQTQGCLEISVLGVLLGKSTLRVVTTSSGTR